MYKLVEVGADCARSMKGIRSFGRGEISGFEGTWTRLINSNRGGVLVTEISRRGQG